MPSFINTEKINIVSNNIDLKRQSILEEYQKNLLPLIKTYNSNGSLDSEIASLEELFTKLDTKLTKLSTTLVNDISPKYNELSSNLKDEFQKLIDFNRE